MGQYVADRRLWLNKDKSKVLEDGDAQAAVLFATPGYAIPADQCEAYRLSVDPAGKIVLPGAAKELKPQPRREQLKPKKEADQVADKMQAKREDKAWKAKD
jgi:hypothetical protein